MKVLSARAASLVGFTELVSVLGGKPQQLMEKVGLDISLLDDLNQMMSSEALTLLLDLAAKELSCPSFGLLLAQRQGISILGPVGLIMRQSPTFFDAVTTLKKYIYLHNEAISFDLEVQNRIATVKYHSIVNGENHSQQITDLALGVGCNVMRLYTGKAWNPRSVYLRHQMPPDLSPYTLVFHAPISFSQEFSGFVFDANILYTTVDSFEPEMQRFLGDYLDDLGRSRTQDIVHQVSMIMRSALPKGHCSLVEISRLMGLKERALQRRLQKEGTTFQRLLDQVRQEIAKEYLNSSSVNMTDLALFLGYSELSVFSRAFKKWFGVAPSRFQSQC